VEERSPHLPHASQSALNEGIHRACRCFDLCSADAKNASSPYTSEIEENVGILKASVSKELLGLPVDVITIYQRVALPGHPRFVEAGVATGGGKDKASVAVDDDDESAADDDDENVSSAKAKSKGKRKRTRGDRTGAASRGPQVGKDFTFLTPRAKLVCVSMQTRPMLTSVEKTGLLDASRAAIEDPGSVSHEETASTAAARPTELDMDAAVKIGATTAQHIADQSITHEQLGRWTWAAVRSGVIDPMALPEDHPLHSLHYPPLDRNDATVG
jgi:hypothetical protein